ncbi:MAG: ABC transporter substrate-binding protein [Actinomycetota bacterium]
MTRLAALLAAMALVAAACGSDDDSSDASGSASDSASASASASASDSASASGSASASEPAEEESEESSGGGEEVTVADVLGDVTVPVTSEGVFALDEFAGIALLSLGVEPVGVSFFFQDPTLGPVIEAAGVELAGGESLEAIAAAQPSLILGIGHPNHLEVREQHLELAPTVTPDFTRSWADQTAVFAAATGTEDRAEVVLSTVEDRVAELAARIDEAGLAGEQIAVIQNFGPEYYAYGPTTIAGQVVADLGFTRSEIQSGEGDFGFILVSEEQLGAETDAAVVISISGADAGGTTVFDSAVVAPGDDASTGVVSEAWTANTALAAWVILSDLESILFGDGSTAAIDDVPGLWDELLAAIEANA